METILLTIIGGFIGTAIGQYLTYAKELKFKRMEKLEFVVTNLYEISHGLHSVKLGDVTKIPNSIMTNKCFDIARIYFPKKHQSIDNLDKSFNECCRAILEKNMEQFMASLSKFDINIKEMSGHTACFADRTR